ncbi:tetratricopeptide repeat protein [Treponema sp. R80B11-R83G3]
MKKRFILSIFTLFLTVSSGIYAQSKDHAPYVTQLKVESRNNLIRLTWVDSPDARGPVYIFRSARPFSGSIPANIKPVVVRYGEQYYIDDADDMENLYYYVAASDTSSQRYDIILPGINSTSLNPELDASSTVAASETSSAATEQVQGISNLKASQDGERVIITFNREGPRRNAILYRSMQPITSSQDLLNAVLVQSGIDSPFVDFPVPVPGLTWYYAVIYEDEIASGNMGIKPGVNTTVSPVTVTSEQPTERTLRPIPLPVLTLRNTVPDSFFMTEIPGQTPLSAASENMLRDTKMPSKAPINLKRPRVFSVDLVAPTGGEESALFQIITEYFVTFKWEEAKISLQHYLSLPRSKDIEARARFYLGQTLYYTGKYRESLMEFLSIRPVHFAEANKWVDAVLAAMVY